MEDYQFIDTEQKLNDMVSSLLQEDFLACDLEASELDVRKAILEGIGLGTSQRQYFIPFLNNLPFKGVIGALNAIFNDRTIIFHNAKYDLELLEVNKLPYPKKIQDTLIMSWLCDENSQHGLKQLTKAIFGRELKKWTELNRKVDLFRNSQDVVRELADYCCEDIKNTYDLYFYFLPILKMEGLLLDYERLELKLIPVLVNMELRGIRVNPEYLKEKQVKVIKTLQEIEAKMKEVIGDNNLNVRSPVQLEVTLFDVLKYAPISITDAGRRSTENEALEDLVKQNNLTEDDFVPLLLRFRDLDKLCSTYFTALVGQADENQIIHTNFIQHGSRTGRLASNEPNLQNIPARSDEWNVRDAFIPREGYKFLIADYSQIELRILAHFSQDDNMVRTFMEGGDIHATTMKLTGITDRRIAKAVNFGLIYGVGPRTLSHTLNIKEEEAKKYIESFFAGYPKVRYYIQRIQQNALRDGYVTMITGRKRRFQEIKDKRWFNAIQRQAINTTIQGSAADLIKIAMVKLDNVLIPFDAHMLVQIHDEIIIETPVDKIEEVKKVIIDTMENALKLRIPIKIKVIEGMSWTKD